MVVLELENELTEEQQELCLLVEEAQQGDRVAFGQLVERYERSVYATAMRRLGNEAEAQELAQEVFVQALRKIDQLRDPLRFGGWLRSITQRMAINRAARSRPVISADPEVLEATCVESNTPVNLAIQAERRTQVHAGLRRLRELDRDTLLAFYVEGQSLIQMSDAFDSPVGTIKRRLHVARKRLAKELETMVSA